MQKELNINLVKKLPEDVIINHILPYTYCPQSKKLLTDIRSFYNDYSFLENIYTFDYNYDLLFYDLTCFCNKTLIPNYNMNKSFGNLLTRLFKFRNSDYCYLNNFVFITFHRSANQNQIRKIRFLWGLLNPRERTRFINKYLSDKFI
jgi:hypothetical protein